MGRIKSKLVKRTGNNIISSGNFNDKFDDNKRILTGIMPSKKIRNQIAGYITRKKKIEKTSVKEV
ncbi:MAG: 30S ribosomal protein S17e [Nanoarchaeota archaeon]